MRTKNEIIANILKDDTYMMEIIANILKNDTYMMEGGVYCNLVKALGLLTTSELQNLDLIVTIGKASK